MSTQNRPRGWDDEADDADEIVMDDEELRKALDEWNAKGRARGDGWDDTPNAKPWG